MNSSFISALATICGQNNVITDSTIMASYTTDWRNRYSGVALAVVFPESHYQIESIVRLCQQFDIALIPQGGNTSTCGAATPLANYHKPQIIINLAKMNKVIDLDLKNSTIHVEAGITLAEIQSIAKKHRLFFPLSIASQGTCQIGGNLATNAGGINVLKYGMMRDLTLGLKAVLPSGATLNQLHALRKNNCYLDLKQLLIGSEGTLGIISEATLKLFPLPANHCTFMTGVEDINLAIKQLTELQRAFNNNVTAFEIIRKESQDIYNLHFPNNILALNSTWLILGEIEYSSEFNLDILENCLKSNSCDIDQAIIALNEKDRKKLWQIREHIPLAEKQHGYAAKHDISLPLSQIEAFLAINMPKLKKLVPDGYFSIFGHLGDGNLHYNFGLTNIGQSQLAKLEDIVSPIVYEDVTKLGGSISAEHGIGQSKRKWLLKFQPASNYQIFSGLKKYFDPQNLFNPGKVL